jgi:hypothetical protein
MANSSITLMAEFLERYREQIFRVTMTPRHLVSPDPLPPPSPREVEPFVWRREGEVPEVVDVMSFCWRNFLVEVIIDQEWYERCRTPKPGLCCICGDTAVMNVIRAGRTPDGRPILGSKIVERPCFVCG